ncbi:MAG: hypothetical protein N3B16_07510, partial [Candidatus Aminicenantes bacterium]|nr:hypothetical protein [Candidatus Aminicenantes bacterium]
ILYTRAFLPGILILRWQILGVLIQVISWPLGYVLRAQGAGRLFVLTQAIYNSCYLIFVYVGIRFLGLVGIGIGFFISDFIYLILIYTIVFKKYKINLANNVAFLACVLILLSLCIMGISSLIPRYQFYINFPIFLSAALYSYKKLNLKMWLIKLIKKFQIN